MDRDPDGDYRVTVKPSALAASDAVAELVAEWGRTVTFGSRTAAERVAADLADRGTGDAWIQSAPTDPDLEAYLVGREQVPGTVLERDGDAFTCRLSADQYGALGETLVAASGLEPALRTYVAEDLPIPEGRRSELTFAVDRTPPPVFVERAAGVETGPGTDRHRWVPDCRVRPRLPEERRPVREYWCEVKTGDGRPERSQLAAMRATAREATVLLVTVDVAGLPAEYGLEVEAVSPPD